MVLLHLSLMRSLLLPDAAGRVLECSPTGSVPLQSVGQAVGKARGGGVLIPGLIFPWEQHFPWCIREKMGHQPVLVLGH